MGHFLVGANIWPLMLPRSGPANRFSLEPDLVAGASEGFGPIPAELPPDFIDWRRRAVISLARQHIAPDLFFRWRCGSVHDLILR
jgi:hypothetical protein